MELLLYILTIVICYKFITHYNNIYKLELFNNIDYKNIDTIHNIPKVIHQVYIQQKSDKLPLQILENINYIQKLNPDWKYQLYTDDEVESFILTHYGNNMLKVYNKINPDYAAAKCDLFRYLLIYKKGGVYLDIKSAMSKPLNDIIKEDVYYLSHWKQKYWKNIFPPNGEFQQWFIISKPKHPYLKNVIQNVIHNISNYDKEKNGVGKFATLSLTGPIVYTRTINKILKKHKHKIYMTHQQLGMIYNNTPENHFNFFKKHYTKLNTPVVL